MRGSLTPLPQLRHVNYFIGYATGCFCFKMFHTLRTFTNIWHLPLYMQESGKLDVYFKHYQNTPL